MSTTKQHRPARLISEPNRFRLIALKRRKFGRGHVAWLAFEEWAGDIISRRVEDINRLSDSDAQEIIEAMRGLHDVDPEGQGTLF
jgi:hypothetical protein